MRSPLARLTAALLCALAMTAAAVGCGGNGGEGDHEGRGGPPSVADVAEARSAIRGARDCPALYDAGAELVGRVLEARAPVTDPKVEAALADADSALIDGEARLECGEAKPACEELAARIQGVDRGDLC